MSLTARARHSVTDPLGRTPTAIGRSLFRLHPLRPAHSAVLSRHSRENTAGLASLDSVLSREEA